MHTTSCELENSLLKYEIQNKMQSHSGCVCVFFLNLLQFLYLKKSIIFVFDVFGSVKQTANHDLHFHTRFKQSLDYGLKQPPIFFSSGFKSAK